MNQNTIQENKTNHCTQCPNSCPSTDLQCWEGKRFFATSQEEHQEYFHIQSISMSKMVSKLKVRGSMTKEEGHHFFNASLFPMLIFILSVNIL